MSLSSNQGSLEHEESKTLRFQAELQQLRAELERRLAEKDEEFDNIRYHTRSSQLSE